MSAPLVLFVGGTRSGKSALAQRWAEAQASRRLFLATCRVEDGDVEMAARVARHQAGRGVGWFCVEEALDPLAALKGFLAATADQNGHAVDVALLDCVSLWIANLLAAGLLGIVPATPLGRAYRDALGLANQTLAGVCTHVVFVSCGLPLALKGPLPEGL